MIFNSFSFAIFFLLVFCTYILLSHRGQNRFLLLASYFFYSAWDYRFCGLLLVTTVIDFTTGIDSAAKVSSPGEYSLPAIIQEAVSAEESSWIHFRALLDYLENRQINFFYIPAPIKKAPSGMISPSVAKHRQLVQEHFPLLQEKYSRFHFFRDLVEHDRIFFRDHVHYTQEGLYHGQKYVRQIVNQIVANSK